MKCWHIITCEYPPDLGGVSDYTQHVAESLAGAGDEVHVWCPGSADGAERQQIGSVWVHEVLGGMGPGDLRQVDRQLSSFPSPRSLFVQWVPHGFGYHSMNLWFCLWLARRAWLGDRVELMVHEPYLEFRGALRHRVMACVHRVMTVVLLAASQRVWISIPAWESRLRPYALGRRVPMIWLPIPRCVSAHPTGSTRAERAAYAHSAQCLVGHFGTYGPAVSALLEERLTSIMDDRLAPALLLMGSGSDRFRLSLIRKHPHWSARVHATGYVAPLQLGKYLEVCDLFVQPYPDGVSSRRTSVMTCLAQGLPVVATSGHLTETLWAETGAVSLADVADTPAFVSAVVRLLNDPEARRALGARGLRVYTEQFSTERVVEALRAA